MFTPAFGFTFFFQVTFCKRNFCKISTLKAMLLRQKFSWRCDTFRIWPPWKVWLLSLSFEMNLH